MIRAVLDTNVFVSGIFWGGVPYQIFSEWEKKTLNLIFSHEILDEYIRVSQHLSKKYTTNLDMGLILESITVHGEMVCPVLLDKPISRDPDDDKFIACALSAECNIIISGDKDLLDISGYAGIKVVKPGEFVREHFKEPIKDMVIS